MKGRLKHQPPALKCLKLLQVSVDQWPLALHFFNKLNSRGIKRTAIVFNTALSAVTGSWSNTLRMLHHNLELRVVVNDVSFTTAIGACENGLQQHWGISLLWTAEDAGGKV